MNTTQIHFDIGSSSLGCVLVAVGQTGLCAILLGDSPRIVADELRERFPASPRVRDPARLELTLAQVVELVEGRRTALDVALDPAGTPFQRKVWRALREIPSGSTASYADIARRIDAPKSFRAVARACGANPLALVIPCHRVLRNDGGLSGYRWGVARKRTLLAREAASRARPEAG